MINSAMGNSYIYDEKESVSHQDELNSKILGFLWGIIPLYYVFFGGSELAIFLNIIVATYLVLRYKRGIVNIKSLLPIFIVAIFTLVSLFEESLGDPILSPYMRMWAFAINLSLLFSLLDERNINKFSSIFFAFTAVCSVIHLFMISIGMIPDHYGRYYFLGGTHHNLGGEIYVVATALAAVYCPKRLTLMLSIPMIVSCYVMQSRTGLLGMSTILIFVIYANEKRGYKVFNVLTLAVISAILAVSVPIIILQGSLIGFIFNDILLAEDINRGVSTGFMAGRQIRWFDAIDVFLSSPISGVGASYYSHGFGGPHNAFLYSITQFGIFGIIFWAWILPKLLSVFRSNIYSALCVSVPFVMLIFNDRFMNSNSFPLLVYFVIVQMGGASYLVKKKPTVA